MKARQLCRRLKGVQAIEQRNRAAGHMFLRLARLMQTAISPVGEGAAR